MVINMILKTIIFSLISLIVLFILTKMMGYRQVTQLSMYDYVIGITIGSIASEMSVLKDFNELYRPMTAMIMYALFTICLSLISRNSLKIRHFIEGNPITLYQDNKIKTANLAKAKLDINEFLMQLRIQGYFDLTQVERVILETNGNLSIFPKSKYRPVIVDDLDIKVNNERPLIALIINGQLLEKQLSYIQKDEKWLKSQLKVQGYNDYKELILVLCDSNHTITAYPKEKQ